MGSVDKFGRSLDHDSASGGGKSTSGLRGPKGEGFVLDNHGNYLVTYKRIKQLDDPEDGQDAVNKRWLESRIKWMEDKLSTFDQDRTDVMKLCQQATEIGDKAFTKTIASESTVKSLSDRLTSLQESINSAGSRLESTLRDLSSRIKTIEDSMKRLESTVKDLPNRVKTLEESSKSDIK